MALLIPMKFERICRTCMSDTNIFHSLFDFVDDYKNEKVQICELLSKTIHKLPTIKVLDDKLPKNICSNCVETVQKFYEFQNCCIESDLKLRKFFERSHGLSDEIVEQPDPLKESVFLIEEEIKQECIEDDFTAYSINGVCTEPIIGNSDCPASNNVGGDELCAESQHNFDAKDESEQMSVEPCQPTIVKKTVSKKNASTKIAKSRPLKDFSDTKKDATKLSTRARIKSCELCNQTFKTTVLLLDHYTKAHPERLQSDELPVPEAIKHIFCPHCKKGRNNLKEHLRSHTKEKPFLCPECGKGFAHSNTFKHHLLGHTDEKRYACSECPKTFTALSSLCTHRHTHNKERPHVCDICGKSFKTRDSLTVHKRTHNNLRQFKCEHCSKDFGALKHLRRHMLTHTGEKPCKCKYCPRSFSQSNDLIKHLRTHLGENVYQCELCPATFPKACDKRLHFATHKNDDEETRERNKRALSEAQEKLNQKLQLDKITTNSCTRWT